MLERIHYIILMRRLRAEIAKTVRGQETHDAAGACAVSLQTGVKTACKACESIV